MKNINLFIKNHFDRDAFARYNFSWKNIMIEKYFFMNKLILFGTTLHFRPTNTSFFRFHEYYKNVTAFFDS